jgi:hypothetical protein
MSFFGGLDVNVIMGWLSMSSSEHWGHAIPLGLGVFKFHAE